MELNTIHIGDALEQLKKLPDECVNCIVSSPPYWGLRNYGVDGQIGQEKTPEEFVGALVSVFREAKRALKDDGTLWLNIGDSYASCGRNRTAESAVKNTGLKSGLDTQANILSQPNKLVGDLKPKDLVGIPWMLAFALRADGWYLRFDIIWSKKNCMPESVTDRPTRSHEYIFLLSKSQKYYYDHEAIKEPAIYDVDGTGTQARKARANGNKLEPTKQVNGIRAAGFKDATLMNGKHKQDQVGSRVYEGFNQRNADSDKTGMRNKRGVWTTATAMFSEAHFATFPEELIVDCIKAGCPIGGVVLDPFMGAGTTALVSAKLNRNYIGVELNPTYAAMADKRLKKELGIFYKTTHHPTL